MFAIKNTVPVRYPPVATWILIANNCVVYLFESSLSDVELNDLLSQFALVLARYAEPTDLFDYPPFLTTMFFAWRLAAPDPQHVNPLAVRPDDRGSVWCRTLHPVLSGLWVDRVGYSCRLRRRLHNSGARCLGRHSGRTGLLHAAAVPRGARYRGPPRNWGSGGDRRWRGCVVGRMEFLSEA
jgi:hypothetical protein